LCLGHQTNEVTKMKQKETQSEFRERIGRGMTNVEHCRGVGCDGFIMQGVCSKCGLKADEAVTEDDLVFAPEGGGLPLDRYNKL